MFSRRKSRNVHNTAYTGVNHVAPMLSQPNANAVAAALTIGQTLKQQNESQPMTSISRSQSIQYATKPVAHGSNGSLLKRNSMLSNYKPPSKQTNQFRNFSSGSVSASPSRQQSLSTPPRSSQKAGSSQHHTSMITYDIDDSFNDSYLDEITEESTQNYYNNHANLKDLKLSHQPLSPPPSRGGHLENHNSRRSITNKTNGIRMVKKYVPTPNGIKIIEVPEDNLAQEIARNNSIRSGTNIPSSNSLNSLKNKRIVRSSSLSSILQNKSKKPSSRLSSLLSSPKMTPMMEDAELESSSVKSGELHEHEQRYHGLQKQIDYEKQLAKDLKLKTLEYEKLKSERLENEKKLLLLREEVHESGKESLMDKKILNENDVSETKLESYEENISIVKPAIKVDELYKKKLTGENNTNVVNPSVEVIELSASSNDHIDVVIRKPSLTPIEDIEKTSKVELSPTESEIEQEAITDGVIEATNIVVDELEKKEIEDETSGMKQLPALNKEIGKVDSLPGGETSQVDNLTYTDGTIPFKKEDTPMTAISSDYSDSDGGIAQDELKHSDPGSKSGTELGIINQYQNLNSSELLKRDSIINNPEATSTDDINDGLETEEVVSDGEEISNLAKQLRPTFDTVPAIIEETKPEDSETLQVPAPVASNGGSSGSSIRSVNSFEVSSAPKHKRPVKSAMKNSSSFYNSNNSSKSSSNPAHEAYLSLTTAENTRLNSKVSSGQLNEFNNFNIPQPSMVLNNSSTSNQSKRISQSLRKSGPQNSQSLSSRSLRPQSVQDINQLKHHADQHVNGGMTNRTLRDRSSVYVQPIGAHPALQPNYQSPSKLKAAELYAKANSRPASVFNPLTKKSSFSKENSRSQSSEPQQRIPRTTLRDSIQYDNRQPVEKQNAQQPSSPSSSLDNNKWSGHAGSVSESKAFKSRFNDSDDEEGTVNNTRILGGGFSSRFIDSHEESVSLSNNVHSLSNLNSVNVIPTLRNTEIKSTSNNKHKHSKNDHKEKRKFGKLRKLFGKGDN